MKGGVSGVAARWMENRGDVELAVFCGEEKEGVTSS